MMDNFKMVFYHVLNGDITTFNFFNFDKAAMESEVIKALTEKLTFKVRNSDETTYVNMNTVKLVKFLDI
jgi:hypothetical protein